MNLMLNPQDNVEISYKSLKTFQKSIKRLSTIIPKKIPSLRTQQIELRRKENLKSLYLSYLRILNLTPCLEDSPQIPFQHSEIQLKSLIQHQFILLSELQTPSPRVSMSISGTIYRNPLVLKIKTLLSPESKFFRPEKNSFSVKSHFFHEETNTLAHRQQLNLSISSQILQLTSGKINSLINKQRKIDDNYRKSYEKLCTTLKQHKLLPHNTRPPALILNPNQKNLASPSQISLKSCRSQNFSEDSASTSRSSSANQRLGFFISTVNY